MMFYFKLFLISNVYFAMNLSTDNKSYCLKALRFYIVRINGKKI